MVSSITLTFGRSAPLPPITRLEEDRQTRRCARLRRAVKAAIPPLLSAYRQEFDSLKPSAVGVDLERYYDLYEISQSDIQEAGAVTSPSIYDDDDMDTLRTLKSGFQALHLTRKLYLCSLLALNADGRGPDFPVWTAASESMSSLTSKTTQMANDIDKILLEEEGNSSSGHCSQNLTTLIRILPAFPLPPTPRIPLTPGKESMRGQMRKLSSLSQGIRGLQAKMHLLRDESERVLDESNESPEFGIDLLVQYDSIGSDLKRLVQEWEEGRTALAASIDKNDHRMSLSPTGLLAPMSPTLSLGGLTAVGGNSPDALKALNGYPRSPRSRSSTSTSSSAEEVFEAVALPRQKSLLTREERIAKMKEDRVRSALLRGKADANTNILKELETVIKLRPRGRTTGRMASV